MKIKSIIIFYVATLVTSSCIPAMDVQSTMYITNKTKDTILIGYSVDYARYNKIDSVGIFLNTDDNLGESTEFNNMQHLKIGSRNLIMPDSSGVYRAWAASYGPRLGADKRQKGYFFIIKLDDARKSTWDEICKLQLYDTLVVTQDMLKEGNIVEYKGISKESNGEVPPE